MGFVHGGEFGWPWLHVDATMSAVEAHAVDGLAAVGDVVVDDGVVVDVGDMADVSNGAVVVEVVAVPIATEEADADVAEAIVDTAVEADVRTPVAGMEAVAAAVVTPVGRRPESAVVGRSAPCAGDPVITAGTPGPVAGRPEIVGIGGGGLIVVGQRRGGLVGLVDGVLTSVIGALVLVALVRGGLLSLIAFALLLRRVGGALAENLRGLAGAGREVGGGGIATRVGAVIDGGGGGRIVGAALAAGGSEEQ